MSYATIDELLRALNLTAPSAVQLDVAQKCLDAASGEIDSQLGWTLTGPPTDVTPAQTAALELVNVNRAMEYWRMPPWGALGQGPELPAVMVARDSWTRHRLILNSAGLLMAWGVA